MIVLNGAVMVPLLCWPVLAVLWRSWPKKAGR